MFSLSYIIRTYIVLTIVVMIIFFVMLTSIDIMLEPIWGLVSQDTKQIYHKMYISVVIFSLVSLVFGIFVSIFTFNRGINKYKDFIRRFDNIEQYSVIRPSIIKFPDQDEFGNLGALLNCFIQKIDDYDQLKTKLAQSEHEKFKTISQLVSHPILVINTDIYEPYISFYNQAFKDTFLKKSMFIDNNGKTQNQYFNFEETPIVYFTYKDEEQTPFLTEQQLGHIINKSMIWDNFTIKNTVISALLGDKKYQCDQIICMTVRNNTDQSISQMMYVYINPQLLEKEQKIISIQNQ